MNGPLPELTAEYTAEKLAACEKVLRTLLSAIETRWRERIVVVGGMVPLYLYDEDDIPDELDPHIGTVDLDIGVGILVDEGDVEAYTALEQKITRLGFERADADNQWRWARRVDGVRVLLEFLGPVSEGDTPGEQTREPIGGSGNLYALAVRGIELVPRDCLRVELEGELLDHGGRRSITAQVANHLPFLMLKAFALEERVKFKDSYDVVWCLLAHRDGPVGVAQAAAESPIARHPTVEDAIDLLREHYADVDDIGPGRFAQFELSRTGAAADEDRRQRLRRQARGTVSRFLDEWERLVGDR